MTPLRRVDGRSVTTVDGLSGPVREALVGAFVDAGASQCGYCTPGILCRLAALPEGSGAEDVATALLAHLCRCTGWRTIIDAGVQGRAPREPVHPAGGLPRSGRAVAGSPADAVDDPSSRRATIEGRTLQRVGPDIVLGRAGFAVDTAPPDALVAVPDGNGGWSVGASVAEARAASGKVQGRRSGLPVVAPLALPDGPWDLTLTTAWVEPGYLEPDASWCEPGGSPAVAVANGGAFGAKDPSPLPDVARHLADQHGRAVLAVWSREDVVRAGPKRPPVAAGLRSDGTGVMRVVRTAGISDAIASVAPGLVVEEVDVAGPPTSAAVRAAGWAEAAVLLAALSPDAGHPGLGRACITDPTTGGRATATVEVSPDLAPISVDIAVEAGDPLDEVVLRSYVTGAAHMALGWVCSEGLAVGPDGIPDDLTIRSWGILRARDTPPVTVTVAGGGGPPVAVADAAFAAVAAACWVAQGLPPAWPTRRR